MQELLNVILLGIIEGITEFLPISSTGHLLIAEHWLGQRSDTFNVVIQAGAMLAVTLVYWPRLVALATKSYLPGNRLYIAKLLFAFMITAVLGLVAKKLGFKLPETISPVAWALLVGGIWILVAEWWASRQPNRTEVSWLVAALVGVAQVVAGVLPGTSRSGATIFAAMLGGTTDRAAATEFAFLVGIPTMYAASAVEVYGQYKIGFQGENWTLLGVAFVVSTIVAFIAIKWLLGYIRSNTFTIFAYYRIALGLILLTFFR